MRVPCRQCTWGRLSKFHKRIYLHSHRLYFHQKLMLQSHSEEGEVMLILTLLLMLEGHVPNNVDVVQEDQLLPPESETGNQAMWEGGCSQVPTNTQKRVKGVRKTLQTRSRKTYKWELVGISRCLTSLPADTPGPSLCLDWYPIRKGHGRDRHCL